MGNKRNTFSVWELFFGKILLDLLSINYSLLKLDPVKDMELPSPKKRYGTNLISLVSISLDRITIGDLNSICNKREAPCYTPDQ